MHQHGRLQSAEIFFDAPPLSLTHRVARVARDSTINRAAAPLIVLCRLGGHKGPALLDKPNGVEPLVPAHGQRMVFPHPHFRRQIAEDMILLLIVSSCHLLLRKLVD